MQSQFLIWRRRPGPRVTINFTFNCQQVLITGIRAALKVGSPLIFLSAEGRKKVNRPQKDKYRWASGKISLLQSQFQHLQIWRGSGGEWASVSVNADPHNGILFRRWAFRPQMSNQSPSESLSFALVYCPGRHHGQESLSQLMEPHQRASGRLCGRNGFESAVYAAQSPREP